jgi:hypothetical protein
MSSKNAVAVLASSFDPAIRCSNTRRRSTDQVLDRGDYPVGAKPGSISRGSG